MDKGDLINLLKEYRGEILSIEASIRKSSSSQIQSSSELVELERIAQTWFDSVEPELIGINGLSREVVPGFRERFGKILNSVSGRPSRKTILSYLTEIASSFHAELIVAVQMLPLHSESFTHLNDLLSKVNPSEGEYLLEAIECAQLGKRRAAVVMGWCAVVSRLHLVIERLGFERFNQASTQMAAITSGRFKRFSSKYQVSSLSDLRMTVFDTQLLWVLEYLGLLDGNEHERLGICLTMRDTSAHPGDARLSDENLLSFFSDIDAYIFSNTKFAIAEQ